jgi:hypothetical protein
MTLLLKESLEERILRAADALQPELRRTFVNAVEELRRSLPIGELTDLIEQGALADALNTLTELQLSEAQLGSARQALVEIFTRSAGPTLAEFGMVFDAVNERSVRWATQHAALMVTRINSETMKAIRNVIVRGQVEGLAPRRQARLIQEMVGLTSRDALAVSRFRDGMVAAGLKQSVIESRTARMSRRLLRRRAENIARTETIRAANMGVQLSWRSAMDRGHLPQGTQKVWIASGDDRTCPICAVLHGEVIDIVEPFSVQEQATSFTRDGQDFVVAEKAPLKNPSITETPPAHPSCRCTVGIQRP